MQYFQWRTLNHASIASWCNSTYPHNLDLRWNSPNFWSVTWSAALHRVETSIDARLNIRGAGLSVNDTTFSSLAASRVNTVRRYFYHASVVRSAIQPYRPASLDVPVYALALYQDNKRRRVILNLCRRGNVQVICDFTLRNFCTDVYRSLLLYLLSLPCLSNCQFF